MLYLYAKYCMLSAFWNNGRIVLLYDERYPYKSPHETQSIYERNLL